MLTLSNSTSTPPVSLDNKKRKLEITSAESSKLVKKEKTINCKVLKTMVDVKVESDDASEQNSAKRRRKSVRCADSSDEYQVKVEPDSSVKNSLLPQKKRALHTSPSPSPTRKTSKLNTTSTVEDDEILIRETEAALKSLSGSYTGPREEDKFEQPQFENLFEEKKVNKITAVNATTAPSNVDLSNPLKDIITLRELQDKNLKESKRSVDNKLNHAKIKREEAGDSGRNGEKFTGTRYEPDFNELVNDSSNELEIDMSESAEETCKKEDMKNNNNSSPNTNNSSLTLSSSSAFRSPEIRNRVSIDNAGIPPIGPFPASATFVGYPNSGIQTPIQSPQVMETKPKPEKVELERQDSTVNGKTPVGSPDSKQYTILQPAGAGSRAATVMEDIAREGVLSVAAVSSSSNNAGVVTSSMPNVERTPSTPSNGGSIDKVTAMGPETTRPLASLSPNSLSRGESTRSSKWEPDHHSSPSRPISKSKIFRPVKVEKGHFMMDYDRWRNEEEENDDGEEWGHE
ncbi:hypothetical protein RUM43_006359 [Polyplax serrata]|uniref:Uncharacterized protein n=1 Tax=Polyplax serrata TaxID=468196 RepID=A0AAN8PL49_POLSC